MVESYCEALDPGLTAWANVCRTYGAQETRIENKLVEAVGAASEEFEEVEVAEDLEERSFGRDARSG